MTVEKYILTITKFQSRTKMQYSKMDDPIGKANVKTPHTRVVGRRLPPSAAQTNAALCCARAPKSAGMPMLDDLTPPSPPPGIPRQCCH